MRRFMAALVLVMFCTSDLLAWGWRGHRVVAAIAYGQLSDAEREKVIAVLKKHPRYAADFEEEMPDNIADGDEATKQEWQFQQSAIWPDLAKTFHGQLKQTFSRPVWHYINLPLFLTGADRMAMSGHLPVNVELTPPPNAGFDSIDMNIIQTIRWMRASLKDPTVSPRDKGLMVAWLSHTIGDLHQPLHSTAVFSQRLYSHGDRGGGNVATEQKGNLHSVWDRFPGDSNSFAAAHRQALTLLRPEAMRQLGAEAATKLDEKDWLNESHAIAKSECYDADILAHLRELEASNGDGDAMPIDLDVAYLQQGREIADHRLVEAGYRLAAVLKTLAEE